MSIAHISSSTQDSFSKPLSDLFIKWLSIFLKHLWSIKSRQSVPFTFSGFLKLSSAARVKSGGILQFRPEIVPLSLLDTRGRSLNGNSKSQALFLKHWERQLVRHNLNHSKRSRNSVSLSSRNRLCLTIILKFQPFLLTMNILDNI